MSNTKTLKGRVINKHKTEAAWLLDVFPNGDTALEPHADAFISLDGELIIYDPDDFYQKIKEINNLIKQDINKFNIEGGSLCLPHLILY